MTLTGTTAEERAPIGIHVKSLKERRAHQNGDEDH